MLDPGGDEFHFINVSVSSASPDSAGVEVLASSVGEGNSPQKFLQQIWSCDWSHLVWFQLSEIAEIHH